jgi:hypothetical protein
MSVLVEKVCAVCGRTIEYRAKWSRDWDAVRYCSRRCRGRRLTLEDRALEEAIVRLLRRRAGSSTVCPSEAARAVRPDDWQAWMERTREAARRLAARSVVEFRQRGRRVDPSRARGALRLARGAGWEEGGP